MNNKFFYKITENEEGRRLDRIVKIFLKDTPLSQIYKKIRKKDIKINNKKTSADYLLKINDELSIFKQKNEEIKTNNKKNLNYENLKKTKFYQNNLDIIYEDKNLLVLNKNSGIAVHGGTNQEYGKNLIDIVRAYLYPFNFTPQLIHRLDIGTSGAIMIAKNQKTLKIMNEKLKNHQIKKTYQALVKGKPAKEKGKINVALERINNKKNKIILSKKEEAKKAVTYYETILNFNEYISLLKIRLETGRMHQIRVHFKSQGNPLIGDKTYGDFKFNTEFKKQFKLDRIFLHSYKLEFEDPFSQEKLIITAPLKENLKNCLEKIKLYFAKKKN